MKLVCGVGSPKNGACWMSALSYFAGQPWSDHPACVSPVIRALAIGFNDRLDDERREAVIGPHFMAPLGTAGCRDDEVARAQLCAEAAQDFAHAAAVHAEAAQDAAQDFAHAAAANTAAHAAAACAAAAHVAHADHATTRAAHATSNAASAAYAAAVHAAASASISHATTVTWIMDHWLRLILACCAVGQRVEVPQVRQLCKAAMTSASVPSSIGATLAFS